MHLLHWAGHRTAHGATAFSCSDRPAPRIARRYAQRAQGIHNAAAAGGRRHFPFPGAACPELAAETAFRQALRDMTLAEVSGDVLIPSNDQGHEMLFTAGG